MNDSYVSPKRILFLGTDVLKGHMPIARAMPNNTDAAQLERLGWTQLKVNLSSPPEGRAGAAVGVRIQRSLAGALLSPRAVSRPPRGVGRGLSRTR